MKRELELIELQKIYVDILKVVMACCEKNSIEFFMAYGSLIGTVRHNGFIPWDEDIDLLMTRESASKFFDAFEESERYRLEKAYFGKSEENFFFRMYVADNLVTLTENNVEVGKVHLDIFILDEFVLRRHQRLRLMMIEYILLAKSISYKNHRPLIRKILLKIIRFVIAGFHSDKLVKEYFKLLNCDCSRYLGAYNAYKICKDPYYKWKDYPKEWFAQKINRSFENIIVPIPNGYHELLTAIFGDYMTPKKQKEKGPYEYKCYIEE